MFEKLVAFRHNVVTLNLMNSNLPIGVFDSGLGGLTVLKSLVRDLPNERFIYLGDTARTPYGSKGSETIKRYSKECAQFLLDKGVKAVVVACNTSSAHALQDLSNSVSCPVIGTVKPAVHKALSVTKTKRIGVIGTEATIASTVYERELKAIDPSITVLSVSCPLFVPVVEQGMFSGEVVDSVVKHHLAPLRETEIDTLILGCTHYPLLTQSITSFMGPKASLIACSDAVSEETKRILSENGLTSSVDEHSGHTYFVTDAVPRFSRLAGVLMEKEGIEAKMATLNEVQV